MMYRLEELLKKMGAPEVRERKRIEWHYFDKKRQDLAGFAEIRLEGAGERLVAELKRTRENYEDDHGATHAQFTETFHLAAERTARPGHFRVTRISFDGHAYDNPSKAIIELGLSVFYSRALDISVLMVEQSFNKEDMLSSAAEIKPQENFARQARKKPRKERTGVVVPFRQRRMAF